MFINAGNSSGYAVTTAAVSPLHVFYDPSYTAGAGTYYMDSSPMTCSAAGSTTDNGYSTLSQGVITATSTTVTSPGKGGFADLGFYPKGTLYFYYYVTTSLTSTTVDPTTIGASKDINPPGANGTCGAGFQANAYTNFTGNNAQEYAVNDYTSKPILIMGAAY